MYLQTFPCIQTDSDFSAVLHVLVELLWLFRCRGEIWQSVSLLLVLRCGWWSSPALCLCQLDMSCQCLSMVSEQRGRGLDLKNTWMAQIWICHTALHTVLFFLLFSRGSFGSFAWRRSSLCVFYWSDFRPTVGFYKSWGLRTCWYKNNSSLFFI